MNYISAVSNFVGICDPCRSDENKCKSHKRRHKKVRGNQGRQGSVGFQGSGLQGFLGVQGFQGFGSQGFLGVQGFQGLNILPINNTVFVDLQFGNDATGFREDETRPFQTFVAALSVAVPGDTIYVHPGSYVASNLVLKDLVNWYFEQGATVTSPAGPIFVDTSPVSSSISGYAEFSSTNGEILRIVQPSNIIIEATKYSTIGNIPNVAMFSTNSVTPSTINVTGKIFVAQGTAKVLNVAQAASVTVTSDIVTAESQFIFIGASASGSLVFSAKSMLGGENSATGLGAIYMASDSFNLCLNCQRFNPTTMTQAIQVIVSPIVLGTTRAELNFQSVEVLGGLLYTSSGPLISNLVQPRIALSIQRLLVNSTASTIFDLNSAIVNISVDFCTFNLASGFFLFRITEAAVVSVTTQLLAGDLSFNSSTLFRLIGSSLPQAPTIFGFRSNKVFSLGPFLVESGANLQTTIDIDQLLITLIPDQRAMILTGQNSLELDISQIFGAGNTVQTAVIDHVSGTTLLLVGILNYEVENSIGITSASGATLVMSGSQYNTGSFNTLMLDIASQFDLRVTNISSLNGGNVFRVGGTSVVEIGNIASTGTGYGVRVVDPGSVTGIISRIQTSSGVALESTSTNNVMLYFNQIVTIDGTVCIDLTGPGDTWLTGNIINTGSCITGINVGLPGSPNDNAMLWLRVIQISSNGNQDVVRVNSTFGGANINYQSLNGPVINAVFNVSSGFVHLSGNILEVLPTGGVSTVFLVDGDASFEAYLGSVVTDGILIDVSTSSGVFWYNAIRSEVNSSQDAIIVNAPGNQIYNFGGYISTGGANVINVINGTVIRLASSTLVSSVASINSATALLVVVQPSSARNPTAGPVTIVPAAAFFVDPLVQ